MSLSGLPGWAPGVCPEVVGQPQCGVLSLSFARLKRQADSATPSGLKNNSGFGISPMVTHRAIRTPPTKLGHTRLGSKSF